MNAVNTRVVQTYVGRAVIAALVTALLVLVPRPAGAAESVETQLTVTAPSSVRLGTRAAISAVLTAPGPAPVPAAEVVLEREASDSSWGQVASATTSLNGTATFSVPITAASTAFRARFPGTPVFAASASETAVVAGQQVESSLSLSGPTTLVDETSGQLSIRWTGADGLPIRGLVRVYQHARYQDWSRLGSVWTDSTGRVRVTIKPRVDTWYYIRGPERTGWKSAVSKIWKVDNLPPGPVIVLPYNAPKPAALTPQRRAGGAGANPKINLIPDSVWTRMYGRSWRPGCPVGRWSLRYLTVNYWGFDGYRHRGELVVRSTVATKFANAMTKLYNAKVPIRAMYLPDRFGYSTRSGGANDYASMRHDNTSAFNCRLVTGDPHSRSPHSYGTAIDLNP